MLIYDANFKLLGMSERALNLLGYPSFNAFYSNHSDISELFVDKDDFYIYGKRVSFQEYMLKSKKPLLALLKNSKNLEIEIKFEINNLFFSDENNGYVIFLNSPSVKSQNVQDDFIPKSSVKRSNLLSVDNIFKKTYDLELQNIKNIKLNDLEENTLINDEWLKNTSDNLSLNLGKFINNLKNLINKAYEKEEILYEAIVLGDLNESVKNLSEIKKLAYSYNIKPLTKAIYRLENSQIDEISKNFRQYKDVIEKIDKTITKRNEIWS